MLNKRPVIVVALIVSIITVLRLLSVHPLYESEKRTFETYADSGERFTGIGTIREIKRTANATSYILSNVSLKAESNEYKLKSKLIITYYGENKIPALLIGQRVEFKGKPSHISTPSNDGTYDEMWDMYTLGVSCKMTEPEIISASNPLLIRRIFEELKRRISTFYREAADEKKSAVFCAVVLGEKQYLDKDSKNLFRDAGISHVLCISGLHISIFGVCIYEFLRKRRVSFPVSAVVSTVSVILFIMMSGVTVSSLRAFIMFVISMGANVTGKSYDGITSSLLSFCAILILNPRAVFLTAFQYSILAVFTIHLTMESINYKYRRVHPMMEVLLVNMAVIISSIPITAYTSYELSTYSPLINIIVIPFMTPFLIFAIFGGLTSLILYPIGVMFLEPASLILKFMEAVLNINRLLPGYRIVTGKPYIQLIFLYYLILIAIFILVRKNRKVLLMVIPMVMLLFTRRFFYNDMVCFIDVGQGDGIYMEADSGKSIMVDGGSSTKNDIGENILRRFYSYHGRDHIDIWFLSHLDSDHISGLIELIEAGFRIGKVVVSENLAGEKKEMLYELCSNAGIKIEPVTTGDRYEVGNITFECFIYGDKVINKENDANDSSLILLARYDEEISLFLGGDISSETEELIVGDNKNKRKFSNVTIFKADHHGSRYSNSEKFLKLINPKYIVISYGKNNRYGHPHKESLERMLTTGAHILKTGESGQVTFNIDAMAP